MPRLPQPGKDAGEWGTILNDFLSSSLSSDGTLKPNTVGSSQLQAGSVTAAKVAADVATQVELDAVAATKLTIPTGTQSTGLVPVATSGSATAWTDLGGVYGRLAGGNEWTGVQNFTGATVTGITSASSGSAGLYVPSEFGAIWSAACSGASTSGASLALIGDSVTFGYNASAYANTWASKLQADLQTKYGNGGSGFISCSRATTLSPDIGSWPTADRIIPAGGAWFSNGQNGPSNGGLATASPVTVSSTLTVVVSGTVARVFWRRFATGGNFTWTIDGVGQGTISTAGADSTQYTEVTGLSTGAHTIVVAIASGQNQVVIHGFSGSNSTGVVVDNFARPGSTANQLSSSGSSATFGKPIDWSGGGFYPRPAKCMLWAFGINDVSASVTEANFALFCFEWMQAQRNEATRAGNVDIILMLQNNSASISVVYADYARRMRALAAHFGAAFIDMNVFVKRSRPFSTAAQYHGTSSPMGAVDVTGNNVHPSDAGSTFIYNAIKSVLVP